LRGWLGASGDVLRDVCGMALLAIVRTWESPRETLMRISVIR
jgi:hypothetical protein